MRERHSPRRVHASAERRVNHDANGVRLVAELLDDERAIVGHGAGRGTLLVHVLDERLRRRPVAAVLSGDLIDGLSACAAASS